MDEGFIDFRCESCKTEIQASLDMIGQSTECPACGAKLVVPGSETGSSVVRHGAGDDDPEVIEAMKSRTIRIELGDL